MSILIEGYSPAEVFAFPDEHLQLLLFTGKPVVLCAGSAQILGTFRRTETQLLVELAQIDGGGEGVLVALVGLARRLARRFGRTSIAWTVYAVDCAQPNLQLRRLLTRRGFQVSGSAFKLTETLAGERDSDFG